MAYSDHADKRTLLDFLFMNLKLDGTTLLPVMNKPFDMLFEGLKPSLSRGDKTPIELFVRHAIELSSRIMSLLIMCRAIAS